MYELDFAGLRPALAVRAKVDQHKVYEQFKLGLTLGIHSGGGQSGTTTTTTAAPSRRYDDHGAGHDYDGPPHDHDGVAHDDHSSTHRSATTTTAAAVAAVASTGTSRSTTPTTTTAAPAGDAKGTQIGVSADLSLVMEDLKQTGAIEIEIIRQQEGQSVDQMEKNAMDLLKETLLNEFFRPAMTTAPSGASGAASVAAAAGAASSSWPHRADTSKGNGREGDQRRHWLPASVQATGGTENRHLRLNVVAPETRTHAPNGFFPALLSDTEKERHLREIDLNDRFFQVLDSDISTTADFEALDLRALVVDLQYGGTTDNPSVAEALSSRLRRRIRPIFRPSSRRRITLTDTSSTTCSVNPKTSPRKITPMKHPGKPPPAERWLCILRTISRFFMSSSIQVSSTGTW